MSSDSEGNAVSQWGRVDEIRKEVQDELLRRPDISYEDVESFRFTTHEPKEDRVFSYPDYHYIRSTESLADHADLIEELLEERVGELERRNITTRTDGVANKHYWVIKKL